MINTYLIDRYFFIFKIINFDVKILLLDSGIGLIPFIREIINENKSNSYYLFMDNEYFPYGNKKTYQLKKRLKDLLRKFEDLEIDMLLICCNTLSNIFLKYKFKTKYKVKTIFSLNLKYLGNKKILVTPLLKKFYQKDKRFIGCHIAESIEKNNIRALIKEIKSFSLEGKVILGCTHYPLAKALFKHYSKFEILSFEKVFINKIISSSKMKFYGRDYEIEIFKKYFPNISIDKYSLT